jgi:polyisoprenoid-binding protein YceI
MNKAFVPVIALGVALTAATAHAQVNTNPTAAPTGHYNVQPGHTQGIFSILHMGISNYYGRFGKASGTLQFDSKIPEKNSVSIDVDMSSISAASDVLTEELKSASVFDVASFPKATFTSTAVKKTGANTGDIMGDLTLHGVTKPVTLHATFNGFIQDMKTGAARLGFAATGHVKRSDFGLTAMRWAPMVADDVDLMIEAEFVQDSK